MVAWVCELLSLAVLLVALIVRVRVVNCVFTQELLFPAFLSLYKAVVAAGLEYLLVGVVHLLAVDLLVDI